MEQKIVDPYNFERMNDYVNKLVELRSKKGMTPEEAKKILLNDPNFFGAMLIRMGDADGMVSGSASPTANVLRAAIQVIGTQPGVKQFHLFSLWNYLNSKIYLEAF